MPDPKPAGTWDFYGACAPYEHGPIRRSGHQESFTLGVFQWVKRAGGKRTKRGKVVYRVKGRVDAPAEAYDAARAFCARKNAEVEL
jgi:hypothetical protein